MRVLVGSVDCHFEEMARLALSNVLNGRPFDEGRREPTYIPDPRWPKGYIDIDLPADL